MDGSRYELVHSTTRFGTRSYGTRGGVVGSAVLLPQPTQNVGYAATSSTFAMYNGHSAGASFYHANSAANWYPLRKRRQRGAPAPATTGSTGGLECSHNYIKCAPSWLDTLLITCIFITPTTKHRWKWSRIDAWRPLR